jgi:hypothetical protein
MLQPDGLEGAKLTRRTFIASSAIGVGALGPRTAGADRGLPADEQTGYHLSPDVRLGLNVDWQQRTSRSKHLHRW